MTIFILLQPSLVALCCCRASIRQMSSTWDACENPSTEDDVAFHWWMMIRLNYSHCETRTWQKVLDLDRVEEEPGEDERNKLSPSFHHCLPCDSSRLNVQRTSSLNEKIMIDKGTETRQKWFRAPIPCPSIRPSSIHLCFPGQCILSDSEHLSRINRQTETGGGGW